MSGLTECDECGERLRGQDSGHSVCLYCRLFDLLDHQRYVARLDTLPAGTTLVSEDGLTTAFVAVNGDGPQLNISTRDRISESFMAPTVLFVERAS
jgi:hypothetical protein